MLAALAAFSPLTAHAVSGGGGVYVHPTVILISYVASGVIKSSRQEGGRDCT